MDFEKIISADELQLHVDLIRKELQQRPELIVFGQNHPQFIIMSISQYKQYQNAKSKPDVPMVDTRKIGKLVQEEMKRLANEEAFPPEEVVRLQDAAYCTQVFGLSFPVLKQYCSSLPFDVQKRDANGYNRYYNYLLDIAGEQFLLCSQWTDIHRERFIKWEAHIQ